MKHHLLSLSILSAANAFTNTNRYLCLSSCERAIDSGIILSAEDSGSSSDPIRKKPLSPKEILEQARAKAGLPDPDEHPKLYSDDLLDDMQVVLRILEKRVQGGQGSISTAEIEQFVTMSNNVLVEMKENENQQIQKTPSPSSEKSSAVNEDSSSSDNVSAADKSEGSAKTPAITAVVEEPSTEAASVEQEEYDPEVEGPDYDPAGGQGSIPKDTTNTYIIPGMDAMSPEEYRVALQQSIIDRQKDRKASGKYGNRNTWDYLNNLSGDAGVLKKDQLEN